MRKRQANMRKSKQIVTKNGKKGKGKDSNQDLDRVGRGNVRMYLQRRSLIVPDVYETTLIYAESQRNIFITAAANGSETWAFTDLYSFRTGVSPTIISGMVNTAGTPTGDVVKMRRYRVLLVKFVVRLQSRELVNPQTFVLHPSNSLPAVSTAAEFQWLCEQQSNCIRTLGPINSGHSMQVLRMTYNPEKFYGEQYHEQDEYSGAISPVTFGSPTTPAYMGLSYNNVNVNTVTTGGAVMTVTAKIKVQFYQPDRDEDPSTFKSPQKSLEDIRNEILVLKARAKVLDRNLSL